MGWLLAQGAPELSPVRDSLDPQGAEGEAVTWGPIPEYVEPQSERMRLVWLSAYAGELRGLLAGAQVIMEQGGNGFEFAKIIKAALEKPMP